MAVLILLGLALSLSVVGVAVSEAATCTTTTSDASLSAVQAAVNAAARGAVVCVPAGSATWSGTLTITKGLTLQGAGYPNTIVTRGGTLITISPDPTAIANEERIAVTGFTFDGNNSALTLIVVRGAGPTASKPFNNLVIGDNRIRNSGTVTSGAGAISTTGQLRGVIYNNVFDRVNVVAKIMGNDDTTEWANGNFPRALGTVDNLYFEDNTIQFSSASSASDPGWTESGQGGRFAVRYNTWNWTNAATPQEIWDIHGFQNWNGTVNSGQTSTMVSEYYGNTLTDARTYRWVNHRGGWGLFFNNILSGAGGNSIDINQYAPGDAGGSGCMADVPGATGVYNGVVQNTYVFNNTDDGTVRNMAPGSIGDGCGVSENNGYWNYNPACTASACSAGIGRGSSPPTGTCTTGTGFWVASTPTPTVNRSVIQAGRLYQCTATNVWTDYYAPFTYPHPLRGSGGMAPPAPTSLSVQ